MKILGAPAHPSGLYLQISMYGVWTKTSLKDLYKKIKVVDFLHGFIIKI
jgi:hypothetical protein